MGWLKQWNTLRNQIFVFFIFVMFLVLSMVGLITFSQVSALLKNNAKSQIEQTVLQASGRIDSLYEQIDMITSQIATNESIQQLLIQSKSNLHQIQFNQRQSLQQIANAYQVYSNSINSVELYTKYGQKLIPLNDDNLPHRINRKWIKRADSAQGSLVWVGPDHQNQNYFLAIRQIRLMDDSFSNGGYLVARINKDYFQLADPGQILKQKKYMILVDKRIKIVNSNYKGDVSGLIKSKEPLVKIHGKNYMEIKKISGITGWTLTFLTPENSVMESISVLRNSLVVSGLIGAIVFLFVSFFLSTIITEPIQKLTKTMRKAKEGILKPNPKITSTLEIDELNDSYNQLVENTNHLIQVVYEKEIIRSHAELKALQAQINPHFLYNTLEAFYWSLDEKGEDELAQQVVALSELFRYTISSPKKEQWVTLKEELDHIERYMQIMKMRFGSRLSWNIICTEDCKEMKIPKLLIQPLVENAILHGVGNKNGNGVVTILVEKTFDSRDLKICVDDNGIGMTKEVIEKLTQSLNNEESFSSKRHGMAIINVKKRLELYFKNTNVDGLHIHSRVGQGTSITFEIPCNGGSYE